MVSQYFKRKQKEQDDQVEETVEVVEKPQEVKKTPVQLDNRAYDVITIDGKYNLVILDYSPESGEAKIVSIQPVNKSIGMPFANKKKALQTLVKDLYKLEK